MVELATKVSVHYPPSVLIPSKKTRWLGLVFSFRGSALSRVKYRLLAVFLVSVGLTFLDEFGIFKAPLGLSALSLITIPLGIFLGFRNNTAYDRYWEGRKLWGALVNTSRSFARARLAFRPAAETSSGMSMRPSSSTQTGEPALDVRLVIAFVHSLRMHLRGQLKKGTLVPYLSEALEEEVRLHSNVPNAILLLLSSRLRGAALRGELSEFRHIELERLIAEFSSIQGGCERIKSTPIPHSYNILIHSIVALYVFALPFGLVEQLHFYTPLMVVIVAYTFLGLDSVGDEIEDPFGEDLNDLPLLTLSRMIEVNLLQMLGVTEVPELLHPKEGRLN